ADVERAIRENRMEFLLNWIELRGGEMFYVDAGTVHAITGSAVIVETQQNSDTTYRLYDYGRPRQLHVGEGLRAVKERTHAGKVTPGREHSENGRVQVNLVTAPSFVVDKFKLAQPWQFQRPKQGKRGVWCLVATAGGGRRAGGGGWGRDRGGGSGAGNVFHGRSNRCSRRRRSVYAKAAMGSGISLFVGAGGTGGTPGNRVAGERHRKGEITTKE